MATPPKDGELEALLQYLYDRRKFDFRGYKRASLSRRIFNRMQALDIDDYERYMEVLEANPGEFAELFNTILINVTSLMRDREAWQVVEAKIIPDIIARKREDEPVRVWSAGAASGEEAYSLAVLFADALGEERFRQRMKIYATDADNDALSQARHGRYRRAALTEALGSERAERFFEPDGDYGVFRSELRRALIFGRHDLVQDPPISRIDLIACRNTLMYFTTEVQDKILAGFSFALSPGGYLFLGKSEALVTRTQGLQVADLHQHILRKDPDWDLTVQPAQLAQLPVRPRAAASQVTRAAEAAFEEGAVAQLVLDSSATIVLANGAARRLLSIGSAELGRHLYAPEAARRPADLREPVERALRERRTVLLHGIAWHGDGGEPLTLDVIAAPLDEQAGVVVTFQDVTGYRNLRADLERYQHELGDAYEELQSTVEELETTNEELQSANEELETTNEELQSSNEELETMNEELQSANEELEAINSELRRRSAEVTELNQFLQSILSSMVSAVIVLGPEMEVKAWNRQAEELWGLRGDEVLSAHFLNLDIGFPVEQLRTPVRDCLSGRADRAHVIEQAVNRRGRTVQVSVEISCLKADGVVSGAIVVMDAAAPDGQAAAGDGAAADGQAAARDRAAADGHGGQVTVTSAAGAQGREKSGQAQKPTTS
jgi:two-component system, chemotaxis family, CheB/CheR fusion protein